jgi:hypothetical protein
MDPATTQQHLEQAQRHAAEGKRLVARQEAVVAELDRGGHNAIDARKVLDTLRDTEIRKLSTYRTCSGFVMR